MGLLSKGTYNGFQIEMRQKEHGVRKSLRIQVDQDESYDENSRKDLEKKGQLLSKSGSIDSSVV